MREPRYVISVYPKLVAEGKERCIRIQRGYDAPEEFVRAVTIKGPCRMVTNHLNPLPRTGVRVWIETEGEIEIDA